MVRRKVNILMNFPGLKIMIESVSLYLHAVASWLMTRLDLDLDLVSNKHL